MSYDNFWEDIIGYVYDAINNELNTQEEIDAIIEENFEIFAGQSENMDDIPAEYKMRSKEFDNPVNLLNWAANGPPVSAIWIWVERTGNGETFYHTFVGPS